MLEWEHVLTLSGYFEEIRSMLAAEIENGEQVLKNKEYKEETELSREWKGEYIRVRSDHSEVSFLFWQ